MYSILKLIHVFAVIIFVGNITVGFFWKMYAEKTKDAKTIAFTFNGIIKADRIFTMPSVAVLLIFGLGAAGGNYNIFSTGWIFWSLILFIISGAVFMARVVPLQKKIYALASDTAKFNWDEYKKLAGQWNLWGTIALIAPVIAVVLMVVK
jgi:uncharacterized membrane protein